MIKDEIVGTLQKVSGKKDVNLEVPANPDFGDYSTNLALQIKSSKSKNEIAKEIAAKFNKTSNLSVMAKAVAGFVNFTLKDRALFDNLAKINKNYGKSDIGKGKTVVIDYSSPNIAKPFGIGHLRSTIIGQALYNLYSFLGYKVIGDNHLGDWGTQFGVLLAQISKIYKSTNLQISNLTVEGLEKMYVDFHKKAQNDPKLQEEARVWFKKLEEGDKQARKIWQTCVDISLREFERIYNLLGVTFDFAYGESFYEAEMKKMLNNPGVKKFLTKGEDGALIVDLTKAGIDTPLMLLKSDGATTYATRDLATIKFRVKEWNPDIIIYEVGAEQTLYFRQIFAAARMLGLVNDKVKLVHTAHGLYLAPDGKKFSTRKGKTVKLEEVLNEAIARARKLGNSDESTARRVGIGAIKYFDLMHAVGSDVVFAWEKIMNMQGNSGPYLQYTYARAQSVLAKMGMGFVHPGGVQAHSVSTSEVNILRTLIHFPEVVRESAESFSPNLLCSYLYDLASKFNTFYSKHRILGLEDKSEESFRIALTCGVGQVLKNGLKLLGIETPEKM